MTGCIPWRTGVRRYRGISPPVTLPCPAHSRRGSEESVLPSFPVILSTAKNPYSCRRPSFLSVQKGCKDTPEGEDSESLPPLDSPHSNGQKGVPFWISPCERKVRQRGRILRLHLCFAQNGWKRKASSCPGRAEVLPGAWFKKIFLLKSAKGKRPSAQDEKTLLFSTILFLCACLAFRMLFYQFFIMLIAFFYCVLHTFFCLHLVKYLEHLSKSAKNFL